MINWPLIIGNLIGWAFCIIGLIEIIRWVKKKVINTIKKRKELKQ